MSSFRGSLFLSDASEMLALSNILPNKTLLDNFVVKRANVYTCHWLHFGSNSMNTVALKKKHPGAWLGYFDKRSPHSDMSTVQTGWFHASHSFPIWTFFIQEIPLCVWDNLMYSILKEHPRQVSLCGSRSLTSLRVDYWHSSPKRFPILPTPKKLCP